MQSAFVADVVQASLHNIASGLCLRVYLLFSKAAGCCVEASQY